LDDEENKKDDGDVRHWAKENKGISEVEHNELVLLSFWKFRSFKVFYYEIWKFESRNVVLSAIETKLSDCETPVEQKIDNIVQKNLFLDADKIVSPRLSKYQVKKYSQNQLDEESYKNQDFEDGDIFRRLILKLVLLKDKICRDRFDHRSNQIDNKSDDAF